MRHDEFDAQAGLLATAIEVSTRMRYQTYPVVENMKCPKCHGTDVRELPVSDEMYLRVACAFCLNFGVMPK